MFQHFDSSTSPDQGPERLAALREKLAEHEVDGFLVPRADAHQGEYVAPRDDRLAWLTGFTGSAGWAVALRDSAAIFTDSRYTVQVRAQTADIFEKVAWPDTSITDWIGANLQTGRIAYDPWLLTVAEERRFGKALGEIALVATENLIDAIWADQPLPPLGKVIAQPVALAGKPHADKITEASAAIAPADACVLTLPDSIAWLLNIRGFDIPRNPVPHAFAILHARGHVDLFIAEAKLASLDAPLGPQVSIHAPEAFLDALAALTGPVQIDPATCPVAIARALSTNIQEKIDPCVLPKARKTPAELTGARAAHRRDGAAVARFFAWLDAQDPSMLSEIDIVTHLEQERRATNALEDISFDTIAGAGPHGAIVHYRVTQETNRTLAPGELLLIDSGGQYRDGTTDITRTRALGSPGAEEIAAFTRVLKGMIAISRLRFPAGLAGRDIDAFARAALWEAGLDYGHGTGHGVGSFLSVHEGPQRIARSGTVQLEPGMILSNEPGFYREGAFGIRIENLIVVREADPLPGQTVAKMYDFETLTLAPIDTALIDRALLTHAEIDWLNAYHARVAREIGPTLSGAAAEWLSAACRAI